MTTIDKDSKVKTTRKHPSVTKGMYVYREASNVKALLRRICSSALSHKMIAQNRVSGKQQEQEQKRAKVNGNLVEDAFVNTVRLLVYI